MSSLSTQRCLNHVSREAVARCPQCRRSYCRECVTEHEGRFLCAACLRRFTEVVAASPNRWRWLAIPFHLAIGLIVAWMFFQLVGLVLLQTPSEWHEGVAIEKTLLGEP